MLDLAIITTAMIIPMLILYRKCPTQYASQAAKDTSEGKKEKFSFKSDVKELFKNKNYLLLLVVYLLQQGCFLSVATMLNSLVTPLGYTPAHVRTFGICYVVSGVIGSIIFSKIVDKHKCYLKMLKVLCIGTIIAYSLQIIPMTFKNIVFLCLNIGVSGFFLVPLTTLQLSFQAELSYPISDSLTLGIMFISCRIFQAVPTLIATYLIEEFKEPRAVIALYSGIFIISFIILLFIKEDLRRLDAARVNREKNQVEMGD